MNRLFVLTYALTGLLTLACGGSGTKTTEEPVAKATEGPVAEPKTESSEFYTWYSKDQAAGRIFSDLAVIDKATGKARDVLQMDMSGSDGAGMPVSLGLSFDPRDGSMYTIVNWLMGPANVSELVKVDPETGATSRIGEKFGMHFSGSETDACGKLYAVGFSAGYPEGSGGPPKVYVGDSKLYSFDTQTGEKTEIGDTGIADIMDLAFDQNGTLWATTQNKLWTIDLETGKSTHVIDITGVPTDGQPRNAVMSIDFDQDGTLYGSTTEGFVKEFVNSAFFTIDTESGAINMIAKDNGLGAVHGGEFKGSIGAECKK